jgi:radical SAM protein with 4Fe4S-binding SPASM domain
MVSRIHDSLRFLSKISLYKVWNAILIYSSYIISKHTQKPIQKGLPFNISIEPTTSCNLGCPECPSGLKQFTRPTGNLDMTSYTKVIDDLYKHLVYLYFYFQGEPYLHPKILDQIKYASDKKIYTVISTNAHYLTPRRAEETVLSGLDRILISIDGATQETYEQYRIGGSLDKVLEGTKNLVEAKKKQNSKTPYIIFQMLVVKPNEHEIIAVQKMGKDLDVDEVKLKSAQIYDYEGGSDLIPTIDKYARYDRDESGKWHIKNDLLDHCWKLWHSCVITWDGAVVPCCFDKDATYKMGNAFEETFSNIWQNDKYHSFRSKILKGRKEIDICRNCTEGTKVWV